MDSYNIKFYWSSTNNKTCFWFPHLIWVFFAVQYLLNILLSFPSDQTTTISERILSQFVYICLTVSSICYTKNENDSYIYLFFYFYFFYFLFWLFFTVVTDISGDNYMFKVNNRNTARTRCEICSNLAIKTPERRQWRCAGVFIVNFEHISHLVVVFLLLTLSSKCRLGWAYCLTKK